jgi:ubiquitin fusion degradation protein 1
VNYTANNKASFQTPCRFGGEHPRSFSLFFQCVIYLCTHRRYSYYSYSLDVTYRNVTLQKGDKVLLPPSAFDTLVRLQVDYPMLFQLHSQNGRHTHSGVLEFTAEEGCVYIPFWMMQNLQIDEGALLTVQNISLPKATFCKLQPQSVDFLEIGNPRAVLEHALRNFSCITEGDIIQIPYNDKNYSLKLCKVEPGTAACIIETDCNVDFEAPLGYVEPDYSANKAGGSGGGGGALGTTTSVNGKSAGFNTSSNTSFADTASEMSDATAPQQESTGSGTRIVNGVIVRPDLPDTDMNSSRSRASTSSAGAQNDNGNGNGTTGNGAGGAGASAELMAPSTGETGVQRNAAIPVAAPAVDYWAVAAGDGARLDGKEAPALKDGSGRALNVRELRAAAALKREREQAVHLAAGANGGGNTLSGKEAADVSVAAAAAAVPAPQKRKSRVGSKFSKLKPSTAAFRGSANSMDTSK